MDPLDRLDLAADRLERRQRYAEDNRLALLTIHGLMGVVIGFLLVIDGTAQSLQRLFHDSEVALAPLTFGPSLGGCVLLLGLMLRRNLALEAIGMSMMLMWDITMAVCFGVIAFLASRDGDPLTSASSYPVGVYLGIAALMATHLVTLIQLLREEDRHADR